MPYSECAPGLPTCKFPRPGEIVALCSLIEHTFDARCPRSTFTPTPATRSWTAPHSRRSWPTRAAALGYDALALTDHDSLCGSLEFADRRPRRRPAPDHRLRADAARRLPPDAARRGRARLPQPVPADHPRPRRRPPGAGDRRSTRSTGTPRGCTACPAAPARGRSPGWSARAAWARPRNGAAAAGDLRPRALLDRAAAPLLARRRPPQPAAGQSWPSPPAGARRGDRRRARPLPSPGLPAGRAGGHPAEHHARRLRGGAAGKPRGGAALAGGRRRPLPRPGRCAAPVAVGRALPLRPDPATWATATPTSRRAASRPRRRCSGICRDELERRYAGSPHAPRGPRPAGRGAGADRPPRLAGFFLLHRDILEMAREVAVARARRAAPAAACCRPAAAADPASARSSAT